MWELAAIFVSLGSQQLQSYVSRLLITHRTKLERYGNESCDAQLSRKKTRACVSIFRPNGDRLLFEHFRCRRRDSDKSYLVFLSSCFFLSFCNLGQLNWMANVFRAVNFSSSARPTTYCTVQSGDALVSARRESCLRCDDHAI